MKKKIVGIVMCTLFVISALSTATNVKNTDVSTEREKPYIIKNQLENVLITEETFNDDHKRVNVSKHVVKGTGMTLEQWEENFTKWIEEANETWNCSIEFHQVGEIDLVDNTSANRTAGAINLYGTSLAPTATGNPGLCFDQNYIEVGPAAAEDTLAHELGHWFGAAPDNKTMEHGDRIWECRNCSHTIAGVNPGDSPPGVCPNCGSSMGFKYLGRDTDCDGDHDANDLENIMYPGKKRIDSESDTTQQKRARKNVTKWLIKEGLITSGSGHDAPDVYDDVDYEFIDITFSSVWIETIGEEYWLHLTILVQEIILLETNYELGFYLESDNNINTGCPDDGTDYYLAYNPFSDETIILINYGGEWVNIDPSEIIIEFEYMCSDDDVDPVPIGVSFTLPINSLERHGEDGDIFSYAAYSQVSSFSDQWPDTGFHRIVYPSILENQPPNKPSTPSGPTSGKINVEHTYTASTTDPDGDTISYLFDWGDDTTSSWTDPKPSGQPVTGKHTWTSQGNYQIKVKARDIPSFEESDWSDPLSVSMPRNKPYINMPFFNFLQNHPLIYQLIQRLLKL